MESENYFEATTLSIQIFQIQGEAIRDLFMRRSKYYEIIFIRIIALIFKLEVVFSRKCFGYSTVSLLL